MGESDGSVPSIRWKVIREERILSRPPWLEVWEESVQLPDGRRVDPYYRFDQPDYAAIFAITEEQRVVGVWHYKHGPRSETLGVPAGYVQTGEEPALAARRELLEETGYSAARWQSLGKFCVDGNRGCGWAHIFVARDLELVAQPQPDDLEDLRLEEMSLDELHGHLVNGRVATLGAAAAIALGLNHLRSSPGQP